MDWHLTFMIIGFLFSVYSVIANDSIQTLGTFMASNQHIKWYWLWLGASSILICSIAYSWYLYGGDISYGRLNQIPYTQIEWYHLLGPLFLLVLTVIGIPVSTTFMVLSLFASSMVLEKMLLKSFVGYGLAATCSVGLWWFLYYLIDESKAVKSTHETAWRVAQWITTGFLWFTWLSHDMANIAVFLPRELNLVSLICILSVAVGLLAYIFYAGGGKIQDIVLNKTSIKYVRSATIIDFVFASLLLMFKEWNDIPMSTTWVFVGLLAGRELSIFHHKEDQSIKVVFPVLLKDFVKMMVGLCVSIAVALVVHQWFQ